MKILFLNTNIGYGGASNMMVWLANILSEKGFDVTFLTYREGTKVYQHLNESIRREHIQLESEGHSTKALLRTIRALHRYIKANKFDLGIAFLSPSTLRLSLASVGTGMEVLISQRGDPYQSKVGKSLSSKLEKWAFERSGKFVFQTVQSSQFYNTTIQRKSTVIPNPAKPLNRTKQRSGNIDNRIVCVARLDIRQKRQDVLIRAFNLISDKYSDITLDLYGYGEDETPLKELAKGNPRIVFHGLTTNLVEDIQNARMSVLSSDFEGIPNAVIEAMSLGIPTISTDCSPGGAALLIQDKVNGLLVPCGDATALAEAMSSFLNTPDFAEQCGQEALKIKDTFSEEIIAQKWINYIKS